MNFSDTFIMALKLAFLFILFEGIYLVISGLIANIKVSYNYRHQLASLTSIASLLPTVLYILAIIILSKSMLVGILLGVLEWWLAYIYVFRHTSNQHHLRLVPRWLYS